MTEQALAKASELTDTLESISARTDVSRNQVQPSATLITALGKERQGLTEQLNVEVETINMIDDLREQINKQLDDARAFHENRADETRNCLKAVNEAVTQLDTDKRRPARTVKKKGEEDE